MTEKKVNITTAEQNPSLTQKMSDFFFSPVVQWLCALGIGGLFIYASIDKILNPHAFARIVYNYAILPDVLIYPFALFLPWVESIAGFFLIISVFRRTSAIMLSSLLGVFIIAIAFNLIRGLNFDCGCFTTVSSSEGSDPAGLLIRDILILIPALVIALNPKYKNTASQSASARTNLA